MEHIVQFGIGIDDEAIKKSVTQHAEKAIIEQLINDVERIIFEKDVWGKTVNKNKASDFVERHIDKFLEDNRDIIIELTSKYLAEKLVRTKRAKEILENI